MKEVANAASFLFVLIYKPQNSTFMNYLNLLLMMLIPVIYSSSDSQENIKLVTGCNTQTGENGINVYDFNSHDGSLKKISVSNAGPNPSFFCFSGKSNLIYAANEVNTFKGKAGGGITTIKYNDDYSKISKVNEIPVPNGSPCYISISPENDFLFVANYTGGSIAVFKLDKDGIPQTLCDSISFRGKAAKVSHAHMISYDPAGKHIYLADLGLDRIMIYSFDKVAGKLIPLNEKGVSLPEGTGPRHFVFNKDGSKMYVMGELKSTVTVFNVKDNGDLVPLQTISALSENYKGQNSSAEILIGNSGEFLYGSNRGENSIVTFRIGKDGLLTEAGRIGCGGDWPRNFTIDPSGKYLLVGNQKSGNISILAIDSKSGLPSSAIHQVNLNSPMCLKFH
jgi:6-phosphogluconolactonase